MFSIVSIFKSKWSAILIIVSFLSFAPALSAIDDISTVTATVNPKIVVDSPDKIEFGLLQPGDIAYTDPFDVHISSNKNWQLDVSASNNGKLVLQDGTPLANPMLLRKNFAYIPIATQTNMLSGSKPSGVLSSNLMQIVLYYDTPGDYSTTLTFIATQT